MNPLYWLELRIRVREKRLWLIALFFVGTLMVVSAVVLSSSLITSSFTEVSPSSIGAGMAWATLFCQAGLLAILAPLATACRISQEREQRTLPALVNSPLPALRVALGKLWGSWTFVAWLGALAIPFLAVAALWGGPPLWLVLACVAINLLGGFALSAMALGFSGLFGRSLTAYLATGSFLFGWIAVAPLLGSLARVLHRSGGARFGEFIGYATLYHNPFYPLIAIAGGDWQLRAAENAAHLAYCLAVWVLVAALGAGLAARSLKREVF